VTHLPTQRGTQRGNHSDTSKTIQLGYYWTQVRKQLAIVLKISCFLPDCIHGYMACICTWLAVDTLQGKRSQFWLFDYTVDRDDANYWGLAVWVCSSWLFACKHCVEASIFWQLDRMGSLECSRQKLLAWTQLLMKLWRSKIPLSACETSVWFLLEYLLCLVHNVLGKKLARFGRLGREICFLRSDWS
jgi:hypothetical protein